MRLARSPGTGPYGRANRGQRPGSGALKVTPEGRGPHRSAKAEQEARRRERASAVTFSQAVSEYIRLDKVGWRNDKHAAQWTSALKTYAEPVIGARPVASIDANDILCVLEPIWIEKAETASRIHGRIEALRAPAHPQTRQAYPGPTRRDRALGRRPSLPRKPLYVVKAPQSGER